YPVEYTLTPCPVFRDQLNVPIADHLRAVSPLLHNIVIGAFVVCVIFIGGGVLFLYLGATGPTKVTIFKQSIEASDVGIVSVFLGAVVLVVVITGVLRVLRLHKPPPRVR